MSNVKIHDAPISIRYVWKNDDAIEPFARRSDEQSTCRVCIVVFSWTQDTLEGASGNESVFTRSRPVI
jgi:hypothetical protein